jgi:hypothetical protein
MTGIWIYYSLWIAIGTNPYTPIAIPPTVYMVLTTPPYSSYTQFCTSDTLHLLPRGRGLVGVIFHLLLLLNPKDY